MGRGSAGDQFVLLFRRFFDRAVLLAELAHRMASREAVVHRPSFWPSAAVRGGCRVSRRSQPLSYGSARQLPGSVPQPVIHPAESAGVPLQTNLDVVYLVKDTPCSSQHCAHTPPRTRIDHAHYRLQGYPPRPDSWH
jgi:hypothetical protein